MITTLKSTVLWVLMVHNEERACHFEGAYQLYFRVKGEAKKTKLSEVGDKLSYMVAGVATQKIVLFIATAVTISNPR
jgi:hypothetical protein